MPATNTAFYINSTSLKKKKEFCFGHAKFKMLLRQSRENTKEASGYLYSPSLLGFYLSQIFLYFFMWKILIRGTNTQVC